MSDLSIHIKQVQEKLLQLLKQHELLRIENERQKKLLESFKLSDAEQKASLEMLRQQQLILKASVESLNEKDKKELEQKINGYVRNIDKCISLLSHKQNL